jgi:hypothetical protein
MITEDVLNNANNWFKAHNIDTFIKNETLYLNHGDFEFELGSSEIFYRAQECIRLRTNNLIKTK